MSHYGLAIYNFILKRILRQKEQELWKQLKYFTMQKKNKKTKQNKKNLQRKSSKRKTKILQDIYYNSIITNLKFQHKPKYPSFNIKKNPHIINKNRPITIIT